MKTPNRLQRLYWICVLAVLACSAGLHAASDRHVVFLTLDDFSRSSLSLYGCRVPEITPHLDRIAQEGMRFEHFHVQASNCTPSRNYMMTGQYQQHNQVYSLGSEGAGNHLNRHTLPALFRAAGYHTGIMGKNSHQMPFEPHSAWDVEYDGYSSTRDPANVYEKTKAAIADAKRLGKPLFFNLNIYDPHTGWYGWDMRLGPKKETDNHPSRIYGPDDMSYPDFFPPVPLALQTGTTKGGTPGISMRQELASYFNSVKRCDDSVGQMLRAFEEAGWLKDTVVVAIADHGMQQPGAKTTLYHEGTVSPLFIRWPGVVKPGSVNSTHMVSSIDIVPTLCQLIGQPVPADLDGRSFLPLITGKPIGPWRSFIYKQQNDRNKSRALQTRQWLYIVNPWADGEKRFSSVSTGTHCWKLLKEASEKPEASKLLKTWVRRIEYRTPEELFNIQTDSQCLHNLAEDPAYADTVHKMRAMMLSEARASGDTLVVDCIEDPRNPDVMAKTISGIQAMLASRKQNPNAIRRVHFDPLDGWMVLGYTLFEPFGEWGIWTSGSDAVSLNANNGSDTCGNACVQFTGNGRMETTSQFDGSVFTKLKLEFRVPKKARKTAKIKNSPRGADVDQDTALVVEYQDKAGWHELVRRTGSEIPADHALVIDAPKGGFPPRMKIGLRAEMKDGQYLCVDGLRLTGWQDWRVHAAGPTPSHWKAGGNAAFSGNTALLKTGSDSVLELSKPLEGDSLGVVEMDYRFTGNDVAAGDSLRVEYYDGNRWQAVAEHDFSYVLAAGADYAGHVVLQRSTHRFTPSLRLRFRLEGKTASREIRIDTLQLRSRRRFDALKG